MLQTKYGLTGSDPYRFVVYEREFPLSGDLAKELRRESLQQTALSRQSEGTSCPLKADS
jgi:hypothetical protein